MRPATRPDFTTKTIDLSNSMELIETGSMKQHEQNPTPLTRIAESVQLIRRFANRSRGQRTLVCVLCLCLLWQPNAAFAAQAYQLSARTATARSERAAAPVQSLVERLTSFIGYSAGEPVTDPPPVDAAISRKVPTLQNAHVDGNLRIYTGQSFSMDGGFVVDDVYVVGTPNVTVATNATYHGSVTENGSADPTGYNVAINGTSRLINKLHLHSDPLSFPADIPTSVPSPSGTRIVNINTSADLNNIGDWTTLKELHVNKSNETITVPSGTYGAFSVTGSSRLNFSGGVYNFNGGFAFASNAAIKVTGQTVINIGSSATISNTGLLFGEDTLPGDIKINVLGTSLVIDGNTTIKALVRVPNGTATLSGSSQVRGQVIADKLELLSNSTIHGDTSTNTPADTTAPTVTITSPANNDTVNSSSVTVTGTAADPGVAASGVAQVTVNNISATYNATSGTWTANVALNYGPNAITVRATDAAGNPSTDQQIVVVRPQDTNAPIVAITSPANGSSTESAAITVSGTMSDPGANATGVASVKVNNVSATLNAQAGTWSLENVSLALGGNSISAVATDNAGNVSQPSAITVTRQNPQDTTAPTITITSPGGGSTTADSTINVTGAALDDGANATGVARVIVNGQQASYNSSTHQWTISISLIEGSNPIEAYAEDGASPANRSTTASTSVMRHTPDTAPPGVTITSPIASFSTYDATVSLAGTAVDSGLNATGVQSVAVNGQSASYNAASHQWSLAAFPLAYGQNHIVVTAVDGASPANQGQGEITVTRLQLQPPTLTITNPQNGSVVSSSSITVAGTAASDLPSSLSLTVNGTSTPINGGQFARTVQLSEGSNTISVIATDAQSQQTQSSITVIRDVTAPIISFVNVPTSVQPGGTYQILVNASDNIGIADVELRLNGQHIETATTAPYQFTLTIPLAYAGGVSLVLSAVARDLTNTTTVATAQLQTAGPGGISGYVFDDTTGYVMAGVSALLNGDTSVMTDEQGVFSFISSMPTGVVRLSQAGYTPVERLYKVSMGEGTALFDVRLTPFDSQANSISASGGTVSGDSGRVQVSIAAGALAEQTDLRVTSASPQGLANLLPYGWSPVPGAIIDVRPVTGSTMPALQSPAHLTISQVAGLTSATPLTLARYDEASHRWMVVGTGLLASANGALSVDLPRLGQYAFLVVDTGSTAPPAAVVDQPLSSSQAADSAALDLAQATAASSPRTAAFSPTARSSISFFATAPSQLPSGVSIEASFGETYNLLGGKDPELVDRPAQDFVLYAYPAAATDQPNRLGAFFIAKPTRTNYSITELFNANVHVEIRSGRQTKLGALIDNHGGSLRASDGSQLLIPANAVSGSQSIFFGNVSPQAAGVSLPTGYEVLGAFDIDLGSAGLNSSATISVPGLAGDLSAVVVARLMTVGGQRSPKVVARAIVDANGKLNSTTAMPPVPAGISLSGIRISGRYLFIRVPSTFGYLKGTITDAATGAPQSMVRVTDSQTPFVDVTASDGKYLLVGVAGPAPAGTNQIGAAALSTDATGTATALLDAQDAVASKDVALSSVALQVDSITPGPGAQNMIATTPVTVTFNKPIATQTLTGSSFTLSTSAGNPVLGSITVLAGSRVAVFTPGATLAASTTYKVTLTQAVRDIYGHALGTTFNSTFSTAATVVIGNRLKPEQITIGYPDATGMSTISIPANSVPNGSSILAINITNGSTVSTVAGTSALVLQIPARVGDEITVTINQPDGTQYQVTQSAYRRADGFVSVGSNGGTITSDDGSLILQVPAGAISGQADLKLSAAHESDISIARVGEMDPSVAAFGGGIKIEAQGNFTNAKELHLELPAPANAQEGQRVMFMKQAHANFNGQDADVWETVTSGKVEGGKIKSTSPPFMGVTLAGALIGLTIATTFFVFMPIHVRVVTGIVQKANLDGRPPTPIPGVLCVVSSTGGDHPTIITHSGDNGRFALANYAFNANETVTVLASDNAGNSRLAVATPYLNTEPGLIGIQSLFAAVTFPNEYSGLSPAIIQFDGQMLNLDPGQHDTLRESGRVATGSRVNIKVTTTPAVADFKGELLVNGASPTQLVWSSTTDQGSSIYETQFEVVTQGSYSVSVTTLTAPNRQETKATGTFNFVGLANPNTRPSLPGPPSVLSVTPVNKAQQIDVGSKIHIEFSEPVKNLTPGTTVYLAQTGNGTPIGGTITSGGLPVDPQTPNISTIDFTPSQVLEGGKEYKVTVTNAVLDSEGNHFDQQPAVPDTQDFTSTFKTFQGLVLTQEQQDDVSYRIAALGDYAITAHVLPGSSFTPNGELTVYDVSKPQEPDEISHIRVPHRPLAVALSEEVYRIPTSTGFNKEYSRIALVTTTSTPDIVRPNNLWIYNLTTPETPQLIGVVSLTIPEATPEIPAYVTIHKKRAYIGAVTRGGCVVVDLEQAIADFERDVYTDLPPDGPFASPYVVKAILPQGGYDREAQRQKASYGNSVTDATPVMGVSVIDQIVSTGNQSQVVPVAYVVPNRPQLISFNLDAAKDGILNYFDGNNDGRDDRVLVMKDLSPVGYPLDVKAESAVLIAGNSKDLAVELGGDRFWIFDVTNPAVPTQYPSRTFVDLGMTATDIARRIELEGTLLYVMFSDKVAVIDISDPTKPYITTTITGIGSGLRWFSVQDGFIYTLASDGGIGQSGFHVSIGRAVAQVIAYGIEKASAKICGNPIVVDRNTNRTAESGGIFFQVYGHDVPQSKKIIIRRVNISGTTPVETVIDTLTPTLDENTGPNIVAGEAPWNKGQLIDQSNIYTAEVVLDEGTGSEFHSKKVEIPLSYLLPFASQSIGIKRVGDKQSGQFGYMLAGTATIKLEIEGVRIPLKPRYHPPGVDADIWQRPFGPGKESFDLPAPKPDGHYRFVLTATLDESPESSDVVEGEVVIGDSSAEVRKPGSPVVEGVELGSGNLALSVSDIEVKGRGLSLSLSRFYNSRGSGQFNSLGYGWRHSYQILLTRTVPKDESGKPNGPISYSLDGAEGGRQTFKESGLPGGKMPAEKPYVGTLVKNSDGSFDYFTKSHIKYHFRQALDIGGETYENLYYMGNLDYIEDPNSNKVSLRYDGLGRMNQVTDASGRTLKFEYQLAETPFVGIIPGDPSTGGCARRDKFKQLLTNLQQARIGRAWRVLRVSGPGGLSVTYDYDDDGNLNFVRRAGQDSISSPTSDRVWQYGYNPGDPQQARFQHVLKSVTAPNNGSEITRVTTYEYDLTNAALIPVKKIFMPESVLHSFDYEFADNNTRISKADLFDGKNQKTTFTLDTSGRPISIVGPRGDLTTLSWTDFGQIKTKLDPEGLMTTIEYDDNQNVSSTTTTGSDKTIRIDTIYDQVFSKLIQLKDGNNNTSKYHLDNHGNVHEIELATGRKITMDYYPNGDMQRVMDQYDNVSTYEYDQYGNPSLIKRQTGTGSEITTQNTFDERSRLLTSQDTLAPSVVNTYDGLDRVTQQVVTDPGGFREQMTLTAQYLPEGQAKTMSRSGGGQSIAVTNKYDGLSRIRQITEVVSDAGTFTRDFTYDKNSNLLTETNRRGVTISRTYDALNFVRSITYTGANSTPVTTWDATGADDLDKLGSPFRVKDQYGKVTEFKYDGLHRLEQRKLPGNYTENLGYDNNNNIVMSTDRNNRPTTFGYDALNRISSKRDPAGRITTWAYDDASRTVTMGIVPQGLTETTTRDALGRILSREVGFGSKKYQTTNVYTARKVTTTDPRGTVSERELSAFDDTGRLNVQGSDPAYSIEQHYGAFGGLQSARDALGRLTTYTLDGLNRVVLISYPAGLSEQFAYDGEGLTLSHTDRRGIVSTMSYDCVGRERNAQVSDGQETIPVLRVDYDDTNNSEARTDANNHTQTYFFDDLHRVRQVVNAGTNSKSFFYDGMNLRSEQDYKGKATEYEYDAVDRLKLIKDRASQITSIVNSDSGGYSKSVTDRRGNQSVQTYDPLGRLTNVTDGGGLVGRYEYDGNNNLTLAVDGRENQTSYSYDKLNRLKSIDHAGPQTELFGYDAAGNTTSYNDGHGPSVIMTYDELNHLQTRTNGEGNLTRFQYDGEGFLRARTDPKGGNYKTQFEYNVLGSLVKVTDAKEGLWRLTYDGVQNLKSVTDALDRSVSYDYDALNRLQKITQLQNVITTYGYDVNNNRTSVTDPKEQVTTIGYDDLDRKQSVTYSNTSGAGPRSYSYTYDPENNLTQIAETNVSTAARIYTRTYDSRNRLKTATDPFHRTVGYDYDAANNLVMLRDAEQKPTNYAYDERNRLHTVTMSSGPNATYSWHPDGLLQQVEYGADMKREYSYDDADRVTQITNTVGSGAAAQVQQFAYTYDANSNRQSETRKVNNQTTRTLAYGYDVLDRMTAAGYTTPGQRPANPAPGQSVSYAETTTRQTGFDYDSVGNRTLSTAQDHSVVVTLTANEQGAVSESRQNNDGPLSSSTSQFDNLNRLTNLSAGAVQAVYAYDQNGNLITTTENNQITGKYEYDVRDQLRRVANGSNQEIASYEYDCERQRLSKKVGGATVEYVYGGNHVVNEYGSGNQLINRYDLGAGETIKAELGGEGGRYYFNDAQGSVTALAQGAAGQVAASYTAGYEYDAWGNYFSSSGSSYNSIGYTGQRFDGETGLMPLGNGERYYSSVQGRFIQQDSLAGTAMMAQGLNRYAYAVGNPTRYVDPTGHKHKERVDNTDAIGEMLNGFGERLVNTIAEPFRFAADQVVEFQARQEGIDRQHVKLSSALGVAQQQAVNAGKDPSDVLLKSAHGLVYGAVTLGIGPLVEGASNDLDLYNNGIISRAEFYHRVGAHSADASMIVVALALGAKGGALESEALAEGSALTAAERVPLSTRLAGAVEMEGRDGYIGFRAASRDVDEIVAGIAPKETVIARAEEGTLGPLLPESSLTKRQAAIHSALPESGATGIFAKRGVSMADLRAIGRVTGDEYLVYTLKGRRFVIRGYGNEVVVSLEIYADIKAGRYGRWSGHTHPPGYELRPSTTDRDYLPAGQRASAIWGDEGEGYRIFGRVPADDFRVNAEARSKMWKRIYGKQE